MKKTGIPISVAARTGPESKSSDANNKQKRLSTMSLIEEMKADMESALDANSPDDHGIIGHGMI